jgi:hypothetical protein
MVELLCRHYRLSKMRRKQMETFELKVSGSIIVEAENLDEALAELDKSLADVLTDWEVEAVL